MSKYSQQAVSTSTPEKGPQQKEPQPREDGDNPTVSMTAESKDTASASIDNSKSDTSTSNASPLNEERRRPDFAAIFAELEWANRELTKEEFYKRYPMLEDFKKLPRPEDCVTNGATAMAALQAILDDISSDEDDKDRGILVCSSFSACKLFNGTNMH